MLKKAFITGVNGQDGSYLAELLLEKQYAVYGMVRRTSNANLNRINHLLNKDNFQVVYGDITDQGSLINLIDAIGPDEFYNLAAQSFVGESWNQPSSTSLITGLGVLNCLEAIKAVNKDIKFYQAGSSEMYGGVFGRDSLNEKSNFYPRSPYAAAKVFGHNMACNYRDSYGMFVCNGILFNHESPRRGLEFVTRKISDGVARISLGLQDKIVLGNIDAKRDWGYAPDYVRAMHMMMQRDDPDDYVIATGKAYSVKDFLIKTFEAAGISDWEKYTEYNDNKFMRPAEVDTLIGDYTKAKLKMGWSPNVGFDELVEKMFNHDLNIIERAL